MREKTPAENLNEALPFLEELNRNTKILYEGKTEEPSDTIKHTERYINDT